MYYAFAFCCFDFLIDFGTTIPSTNAVQDKGSSNGQLAPWEDTSILHSRPIAVKIKMRPADGNYEASNDISGYDAIASQFQTGAHVSQGITSPPQGVAAPPQQSAPAQTPPQQQVAAPTQQGQPGEAELPPWQRKS